MTDAPQADVGARHSVPLTHDRAGLLRAAARARGPAGHRGDQRQLHHAGRDSCPHGIRSRIELFDPVLTSLERSTFEPAAQLAPHNPLIWRASHNRTKMAVVRLCQRRGPERNGKQPKMGFRAGARGSDK
jgi:hypothetical protein